MAESFYRHGNRIPQASDGAPPATTASYEGREVQPRERARLRREKHDDLLRQQVAYKAHGEKLRKRLPGLQADEIRLNDIHRKLSLAVDLGHKPARQERDTRGGISDQLGRVKTAIFTVHGLIAGADENLARVTNELANFGAIITEDQEGTILAEADALVASLKG